MRKLADSRPILELSRLAQHTGRFYSTTLLTAPYSENVREGCGKAGPAMLLRERHTASGTNYNLISLISQRRI